MPPKKAKTRHSTGSCFGPPSLLPDIGSLYTLRDVLAAIEMERSLHPDQNNRWCAEQIAPLVKAKWAETNPQLVLIQDVSIVLKLIRKFDKALLINAKKGTTKQKEDFLSKIDKLFDILVCQCPIEVCFKSDCNPGHCQNGAHITCNCLKQFKVPTMELAFIKDQREKVGLRGGEMLMAGADKAEARRQAKQKLRAPKESQTAGPSSEMEEPCEMSQETEKNDSENNDMETQDDQEYTVVTKPASNQNTTDMTFYTAEVCRYGISDRAAAALYNAALKTVNLISDDETKLVVDKSKVRRAREIFSAKQKNLRQERLQAGGGIQCLGTDGKRDKKTRVCEVQIINGEPKEKFSIKTREHIVYTQEPAGEYLCHSEVDKGTGRHLANDSMDVLAEHDSLESLLAVVADGTPTNTGWKDGMIAHLERDLQRPLLWLICQLHGNELGLRHYFDECDGGFGTSGPDSFKGPIGKACKGDLHLLDAVDFEKIETSLSDLEEKVWKDLSRDQQLLYRWTKAVGSGVVPPELAGQVAGPINHSRWLTLAVRLLQLYTKTPHPSSGLTKVVKFIVQTYSPGWFQIKCNSKFTSGPANLYHQMQMVNNQPREAQDIVKPVVQRNAYFAQPGVILCGMLESENEEVRCKAVNLIKAVRSKPPKPPRAKVLRKMRKFVIPPLRWDADAWWNIIDWSQVQIVEPSILSRISTEMLEQACQTPMSFPKFPCHSQSVERAVNLVTQASCKVCGGDNRHNHIVSVIASRKARKAFNSKKNYKYSDIDQ